MSRVIACVKYYVPVIQSATASHALGYPAVLFPCFLYNPFHIIYLSWKGWEKADLLFDDEFESVCHVLWEYPAYSTPRNNFMCELQELLRHSMDLNVLRAWTPLKTYLLCRVLCAAGR